MRTPKSVITRTVRNPFLTAASCRSLSGEGSRHHKKSSKMNKRTHFAITLCRPYLSNEIFYFFPLSLWKKGWG